MLFILKMTKEVKVYSGDLNSAHLNKELIANFYLFGIQGSIS